MAEKENDIERINELIEIMKQNNLLELEIQHGDDKISLKREGTQKPQIVSSTPAPSVPVSRATEQPASTPQQQVGAEDENFQEELVEIKAPMVGTFYAAPSPDSEDFVEEGTEVNLQTVVCIIEAMKVMNEIKAESSGTVEQILVKNGEAVEYGQALFRLRPE